MAIISDKSSSLANVRSTTYPAKQNTRFEPWPGHEYTKTRTAKLLFSGIKIKDSFPLGVYFGVCFGVSVIVVCVDRSIVSPAGHLKIINWR